MTTWFSLDCGDGLIAYEPLGRLEEAFSSAYVISKNPKEMAAFIRHESEGRLHCLVRVYLSPASASVATAIGAVPCEKPSPDSLSLFAGPEESWPLLFPELKR